MRSRQVTLNTAVVETVRDLIGGAAITVGDQKRASIWLVLKLETPPAQIFPAARSFSNPATTLKNWELGTGECSNRDRDSQCQDDVG